MGSYLQYIVTQFHKHCLKLLLTAKIANCRAALGERHFLFMLCLVIDWKGRRLDCTPLWKRTQVWFWIPVKIPTEYEILMPQQSNKARKKKICWGTYYKKFQNHFPHCKNLRCMQCPTFRQKHITALFNDDINEIHAVWFIRNSL